LSGSTELVGGDVRDAFDLAVSRGNPWSMGELGWWLWRVGELTSAPDRAVRPFALQIEGDWAAAAREWAEHGFPYEAAMALVDSPHERDLRAAADTFDNLGAPAAREFANMQLRRIGATVQRGPRRTTRRNPAQLTDRELEVLTMVERGMTDSEIAKSMFVSIRTVNNHVSSILAKLQVSSRGEAARKATQLQPLGPQDA
jgi:DNA-binding CsgD family transcriptional regulator